MTNGTIEAISTKNKGIKVNGLWYNFGAENSDILATLQKGDAVEFEIDLLSNKVKNFKLTNQSPKVSEENLNTNFLKAKILLSKDPQLLEVDFNSFTRNVWVDYCQAETFIIGVFPQHEIHHKITIYYKEK